MISNENIFCNKNNNKTSILSNFWDVKGPQIAGDLVYDWDFPKNKKAKEEMQQQSN